MSQKQAQRRQKCTDSSNPPPLGLVRLIKESVRVSKHVRRHVGREVLHRESVVAAKYLRRLVYQRGAAHLGHLKAAIKTDVIHCGREEGESQRCCWPVNGC